MRKHSKMFLALAVVIVVSFLATPLQPGGREVVAQGQHSLILPFIAKKLNTGPGTVIGKVVDSTTQAAPTLSTPRVCFGNLCTFTNAAGEYVLTGVPYGLRTLTASADYYFPLASQVMVKGGETVTLNFAIYPDQPGGTRGMEVVLTWRPERTWPGQGCDWVGNPDPSGNCLNDLDTHAWLIPLVETPDLYPVHIDASNRDKWGVWDYYPSTRLRFDERWGSGPETLRVRYEDVFYHYAVLNVNQIFSTTVPRIRDMMARVYVRDTTNGQLLLDLTVPTQGEGEMWYVFTLNGDTGDLTVMNCLTDLPASDLEPPTCP